MTTHTATGYGVRRTRYLARGWLASGRRQATAALALYAAISIGYFGLHVLPHLGTANVGLPGWSDPTIFMWSLAWWPHALLHGLNPFLTNALFVPDRVDLGGVTAVPLAALVAAPITLMFGPIVSYNLLMLASPALAAFFAFLLCRYITRSFAASLVGGYVFGFSTYILGQMLGHLHLVLIFPIPGAVHLTLRLIDGRIRERRFIALMALCLVTLFLSSSELAFTFVLLGAVALAVAFAFAPAARERIIVAVKLILASGVAAVLVTSPFIYYGLKGNVQFGPTDNGGGDAVGFFVPSSLIRLGRKYFAAVANASNNSHSLAECATYIGLPLALIVGRYSITRWRMASTRILVATLAIVVVLLFGARLHIVGYPTIPLPWKLIDYSLVRNVVPSRLGLYMFLVVGVIAAMWLAQPRAGRWGVAKWAVAAVSIAFVVPNIGSGFWRGSEPNSAFFTTHEYRSVLRPGETVLALPFGEFGTGMLWQAETGMWFRLAGGFVNPVYPADYRSDPLFPALFGKVTPNPQTVRSFLVRRHVGAVIVNPATAPQWLGPLAALGLKPMSFGGILVYRV
jgi:hypothetical protein